MRISNNSPIHIFLVLAVIFSLCTEIESKISNHETRRFQPTALTENPKQWDVRKQRNNPLKDVIIDKQTSVRGGATESSGLSKAIYGVAVLALVEKVVKRILVAGGFNFPAMLGGCLLLFGFLVISEFLIPGSGESMFISLSPAAALLAKWIGVFFVPGLVMLPLAPSIGSGIELLKVFSVICGGFLFSLASVSFSVLGLRKAQGAIPEVEIAPPVVAPPRRRRTRRKPDPPSPPIVSKPAKPYSDATMKFLGTGALISLPASIIATRYGMPHSNSLQTIAMLFATVAGYVWGARLPPMVIKVVHPILTSAMVSLGITKLVAIGIGSTFRDVLRTYRVGSLSPSKTGAGDILLYLLSPATISFSISMYGRKRLLKENLFIVIWSMVVSSMGGLFATAAFVRLVNIGGSNGNILRLSLLPRNVTTPLAIVISVILGGNMAIAASMAIATAILGGTFGRTIVSALGITDPVSRGLAIGAAGQGLGVASLAGEPDAFPFAAMSLVLTAIFGTILVCIPIIKESLINLALG